MNYVNSVSIDDMRREIIDRYGPTIHNQLVSDMPGGRIVRIYIQMNKVGPMDPSRIMRREAVKVVPIKRKKKAYFVEGQMSLFD